jgi:hypothetical protein
MLRWIAAMSLVVVRWNGAFLQVATRFIGAYVLLADRMHLHRGRTLSRIDFPIRGLTEKLAATRLTPTSSLIEGR